jgi:hypothetical protein
MLQHINGKFTRGKLKSSLFISLNDSNVGDFVDRFYPTELQIKDTKDTAKSASFIALHLEIDNEAG